MPFKSMLPALTTLPLFYQIKSEDILALLSCMGASLKTFKKGEFLVSEGQDMTGLLILLKGQALLYKNTDASSSLLGAAPEGHVLGAASIGRDIIPSLMSAKAAVSCTALFVPYRRLMFQCSKRCPFHRQMIENLVISISRKPSANACWRFCRKRPPPRARAPLPCPTGARNWPTICALTAAR